MKRDGRSLAHNTLEEMRILAVQRMAEGEHPNEVAAFVWDASLVGVQDQVASARSWPWCPGVALDQRHRSPAYAHYNTGAAGLALG
jgi:hypothetical protein